MKRFWRLLLRKGLPSDALSGTHVAVFGLGDSGEARPCALGPQPLPTQCCQCNAK